MEEFDFLEQLVNPCIVDRLSGIYQQDETCQKRLKEEGIIYDKLSDGLTDEQAERLEDYVTAASATAARKETLTYVQGMRDLLALLKVLSYF